MARKRNIWRLRLLAFLVYSAFFLLPEFAGALEALDSDDLQRNSPALKTDTAPKPAADQTFPGKHTKDPHSKDDRPIHISTPDGDDVSAGLARQAVPGSSEKVFYNSVCFKCHGHNSIHPAEKTRKQWRLLIEKDGHSVIEPIPWSTPEEKQQVMEYLLNHAKDNLPQSEGIGVWK